MNIRAAIRWAVPHGIIERRQAGAQSERQRALYRSIIPPNSLVFDVGSNVGNRIDAFLGLASRVIAIEPQPACVAVLRRKYGHDPRLVILEQAVGSAPGTLPLHIGPDRDTVASLSPQFIQQMTRTNRFGVAHRWGHTIEVPVTTLDAVIKAHGVPAFIKIDVEGFEREVLDGLSTAVDALSFEWTPDMPDAARGCIDRCLALGMPWFQFSFGETMRISHRRSLDAARAKELVTMLAEEECLFGDIYASREPIVRTDGTG